MGKLDAIKFKLKVDLKKLLLIVEHSELMQAVQKNKSMGKRESKFSTNQNISHLEREVEKTSKQIQNELYLIDNSKNAQVTRVYKLELNELFSQVETYFQKKSMKLQKKSVDYTKNDFKSVKSKVDVGAKKVTKRESVNTSVDTNDQINKDYEDEKD